MAAIASPARHRLRSAREELAREFGQGGGAPRGAPLEVQGELATDVPCIIKGVLSAVSGGVLGIMFGLFTGFVSKTEVRPRLSRHGVMIECVRPNSSGIGPRTSSFGRWKGWTCASGERARIAAPAFPRCAGNDKVGICGLSRHGVGQELRVAGWSIHGELVLRQASDAEG